MAVGARLRRDAGALRCGGGDDGRRQLGLRVAGRAPASLRPAHGLLLLRAGVVAAAAGLLWFAAATELWEFVLARALLGAGVGMIIPPARRAIVLTAGDKQGERLGVFYAAYIAGFVFGPPVAGAL